ncbi:MAG: hypothetical protein D3918_12960 [Candidatus Electrothrix sp. AX2]|nr:hypothetical protein [Candidatus Electrothrix gigas]
MQSIANQVAVLGRRKRWFNGDDIEEQVDRFKKLERTKLPDDMEYKGLPGLSNEVVEKLNRVRPLSLGQASRISGVTPAAVSVLQVHLKKMGVI